MHSGNSTTDRSQHTTSATSSPAMPTPRASSQTERTPRDKPARDVMPPKFRALRAGIGALARVSPSLAARAIFRVWFSPPRRSLSVDEQAQLASGDPLTVSVDGRRVAAWSFGEGPTVLLVHGWGGRAGQMLPFVAPLVEAGARAVVFDALGHGASEASTLGRRQASFVDVARSMEAVAEKIGAPEAFIAHSGGAVASGIALQRGALRPNRLALIAPMVRPLLYAERFDAALGLSAEVSRLWRAHAEKRVGFAWDELDLTTSTARYEVPSTLILHDRRDKEVPFGEGEALAASWLEAGFVATTDLGHQRILRDAGVIRRVVDFIRPS